MNHPIRIKKSYKHCLHSWLLWTHFFRCWFLWSLPFALWRLIFGSYWKHHDSSPVTICSMKVIFRRGKTTRFRFWCVKTNWFEIRCWNFTRLYIRLLQSRWILGVVDGATSVFCKKSVPGLLGHTVYTPIFKFILFYLYFSESRVLI